MKRIAFPLWGAFLLAGAVIAKDFKNGDFADGKSPWLGDGAVVYVKPDGTVSSTKSDDAVPVMEIKLNSTQFREISQKFETGKDTGALQVEVSFKASPDFLLNGKSTKFTRDNTWGPGTLWYWTGLVYPKVDLCLRLDKWDGFCYGLEKVQPGADWKTMKVRWDNIGAKKDVKLSLLVPPGNGTILIKSVTVGK